MQEVKEKPVVTPWIAAQVIAEELQEPRPYKHYMLKRICQIVSLIGLKRSIELTIEAQQLYDFKKILVKDGSRQKSKGGIFFSLAENELKKMQIEIDKNQE